VIDGIITEPVGGAHRAPEDAIQVVGETVSRALSDLSLMSRDDLRKQRREKYLSIGRSLTI